MKTYKCIIVEDEINASNVLKLKIAHFFPEIEIIGIKETVKEAVSLIIKTQPDIVFLDIELKDGSGFEVLEKCTESDASIIFTTSFDQFAIRAFQFNAIDYLLKPISNELLIKAIKKGLKSLNQKQNQEIRTNLVKNLSLHNNYQLKSLAISTRTGFDFMELNDICYLEADGSYTCLYSSRNKKIISSRRLKYYEEVLGVYSNFYRIHNSYIVNLQYLKSYNNEGYVVLKDNRKIPLSRSKKKEFLRIIDSI